MNALMLLLGHNSEFDLHFYTEETEIVLMTFGFIKKKLKQLKISLFVRPCNLIREILNIGYAKRRFVFSV